jgi:hypothetical protein
MDATRHRQEHGRHPPLNAAAARPRELPPCHISRELCGSPGSAKRRHSLVALTAAGWGIGSKPTAAAACLDSAPAASFTPRWAIRTRLVVPPGGTCSRRARSSPEWPGPCPSSRASGPRRSQPEVRPRATRTAPVARNTPSVVPAPATRAHAGPAEGSSLSAIPSEGELRAVRGFAASEGSARMSASASRKAPTGHCG